MKIGIAVLAATVAFGTTAASAQPGWYGYGYRYGYDGSPYGGPYGGRPYAGVSQYRVLSIVRAAGLRPVSEAMRMGRTFVVDAVDSSGRLRRVTVDAYYGQVVHIAAVSRPDYPPRRMAPYARPGAMPDDADGPDEDAPPQRRVMRRSAPPAEARLPDEDEAPPPSRSLRPGAADTPVGRDIPPPPAPLNMHRAAKPVPPKHENKTAHGSEPSPTPANDKPHTEGDRSAAINPHPAVKPAVEHKLPVEHKAIEKHDAKPAAKPVTQAAAPRVVLPGGPPAKTGAAPAPAAPAHTPSADKPAADKTPAPGSSNLPPVQSLD